ncbi:hypothetical protein O7621_15135 [Solwaraspora sp. WMMD937]|uniref:hypothetical protein n=1 Tax=Solwaraspora sp. WMMD937 TaxID=3016090 RepID=UPI00249A65A8|nr:hypothetical protein [Solwaraspora sp. WMMD937]WFE19294.1 hypothetical protein O7621_15135 [Solwaraspora sp. WMMD937]
MSTLTRLTGRPTEDPTSDPVDARRTLSVPGWLPAAGWATLVGVLAVLLLYYWDGPPYNPDSWRYYELSQTLGGDFFRIASRHSYQSPEPYSMGCGPLWPILVGVTAALSGTGPQAGLLAAAGCVLAMAAVLSVIGRRVGVPGLGPVVTVGLLGFVPFLDEMLTARTFPLAGLLLSLLLLALVSTDRRAALAWPAAGAAGGGLVLTRPDTLPAVLLLAVLLVVIRRRDWRWLLPAGLVFTLVMSPWAVYGLVHFGTPFPADNRIIALAVPQLYVTDVIDVDQLPTAADDPIGWLARLAGNAPAAVLQAAKAAVWAPTVVTTTVAAGLLLRRGRRLQLRCGRIPLRHGPRWLLVGLAALATFTAQVAFSELSTGYLSRRYLSLAVLLTLLTAVVLILRAPVPARLTGRRTGHVVGVLLLTLPAGWALGHQLTTVPADPESLTGGVVEQELRRCRSDGTLTIVTSTEVGRHSALTGRRTAFFPDNFADIPVAQRRDWIATWGVDQLYLLPLPADADPRTVRRHDEPRSLLATAARVTPDPCATAGRLYRVSLG